MVDELGALGSFGVDYVLGDLWSRPQLERRDRSMIVIAILSAFRADDELAAHVHGGLNHGLTRTEIEEIILQVAGYAGFPAAMHANRVASRVFAKREGTDRLERSAAVSKDDAKRRADANDVRQTLTAGRADPDPEVDLENMVGFLGDVGLLASQWAFGELWARTELSRRDRSLIVIAVLTALGRQDELAVHIPGGLNHGLTRTEITEVMVQMTVYGGFPRAVDGYRAAQRAFAKIDARAAKA
jgi:4-carboxymuconolactone decarboxylase